MAFARGLTELNMTIDTASDGIESVLKKDTELFVVIPESAPLLFKKLLKQCAKGIEEKYSKITTDSKCNNCLFVVIDPNGVGENKVTWTETSGFMYNGIGSTQTDKMIEQERNISLKIYSSNKLSKVIYEAKGLSTGTYGLSRVARSMCAGIMHSFPESVSDQNLKVKLRED